MKGRLLVRNVQSLPKDCLFRYKQSFYQKSVHLGTSSLLQKTARTKRLLIWVRAVFKTACTRLGTSNLSELGTETPYSWLNLLCKIDKRSIIIEGSIIPRLSFGWNRIKNHFGEQGDYVLMIDGHGGNFTCNLLVTRNPSDSFIRKWLCSFKVR